MDTIPVACDDEFYLIKENIPDVLFWMVVSNILTMSSSETSFSFGGMMPFALRTSFHSVSAFGS